MARWGGGGDAAVEPAEKPGPLMFMDVTMSAGLPPASADCAAFRDLDGDGRDDILLSPLSNTGKFAGQLVLLLSRGGGTFESVPIATTLKTAGACEIVDVDGDGRNDIVIEDNPFEQGATRFEVLHNGGGAPPAFSEQPLDATRIAAMHQIGFFDYDNDGQLDLFEGPFNLQGLGPNVERCDVGENDFQCHMKAGTNVPASSVILRGMGGGHFVASPLAGAPGQNNAPAFIDWNGDGFVDLFQSNDFGVNQLLLNQGGKSLADALPAMNAAPYNHGMGVAFADFNRDGRWDFYGCDIGPDQLYYGKGEGAVQNVTAMVGLVEPTRLHSGWAPLAADFNNDAWTDLFVLNTALVSSNDELKQMVFDDIARTQALQEDFALASWGGTAFVLARVPHRDLHFAPVAQGSQAMGDFDGDGRVDVLTLSGPRGEVRLLRNVTDTGRAHWLDVHLVPGSGNSGGRGALVIVRDGPLELGRHAVGVEGHRINSTLDAHFGLGAHTSVQVSVRWPGGGMVQEVAGPVGVDGVLVVHQP